MSSNVFKINTRSRSILGFFFPGWPARSFFSMKIFQIKVISKIPPLSFHSSSSSLFSTRTCSLKLLGLCLRETLLIIFNEFLKTILFRYDRLLLKEIILFFTVSISCTTDGDNKQRFLLGNEEKKKGKLEKILFFFFLSSFFFLLIRFCCSSLVSRVCWSPRAPRLNLRELFSQI